MRINVEGLKEDYAIALQWVVETRSGIETIQHSFNLTHGLIVELKGEKPKGLKYAGLVSESYDKSYALAAMLAKKHRNLILIHQVEHDGYWLCIIKDHEIWGGHDVGRLTAGDYIASKEELSVIIAMAKKDIAVDGVAFEDILKVSKETDGLDFADQVCDFSDVVKGVRSIRKKYRIKFLQPTKVLMQKLAMMAGVLVILLCVGVYAYHQRMEHQSFLAGLLQQKQAQLAKEKEKSDYFKGLQHTLHQEWGYKVVLELMGRLKSLGLQSEGWSIDTAQYNVAHANKITLNLDRTNYGTVDSFKQAYGEDLNVITLSGDNDKGKKVGVFKTALFVPSYKGSVAEGELTSGKLSNRYHFISYLQMIGMDYTLLGENTSSYGVHSIAFEMKGDALWKLKKLESVFVRFKTLTVSSVDFKVQNYDMSWDLKGDVYA
jgi:hypothetical protein